MLKTSLFWLKYQLSVPRLISRFKNSEAFYIKSMEKSLWDFAFHLLLTPSTIYTKTKIKKSSNIRRIKATHKEVFSCQFAKAMKKHLKYVIINWIRFLPLIKWVDNCRTKVGATSFQTQTHPSSFILNSQVLILITHLNVTSPPTLTNTNILVSKFRPLSDFASP